MQIGRLKALKLVLDKNHTATIESPHGFRDALAQRLLKLENRQELIDIRIVELM